MSDAEKDKQTNDVRKQSDKKEPKSTNTGSKNTNERDDKSKDEKKKDVENKSNSSTDKKPDLKLINDKKNNRSENASDKEKCAKTPSSTSDKESDKSANCKESNSQHEMKPSSSKSDTVGKGKSKDTDKRYDEKSKSSSSRPRISREKSKSPINFVRNYHYKESFDNHYRANRAPNRRKSRSPPHKNSRSPSHKTHRSPVRRRSRSPVRRPSPSFRNREPWRRSPRRRSRSPRDRIRSPVRPYSRSRSPGGRDPKALIAKKSFLDDLAVKFAQEGKEFPELEQYRCEINSQFTSYPIVNQFAINAVEHVFPNMPADDAFLDMNMMPQMNAPINNPIVLTDPYNAYPIYSEPPVVSDPYNAYPNQGDLPVLNAPSPLPSSLPPFENTYSSMGSSSATIKNEGNSKTAEIWTKQDVKIRIKQALQLLDHVNHKVSMTGKFMFRPPTFYDNDVNVNRSPIVQSDTNPLYAFSSPSGSSSNPFGNVPAKIKAIVDVLRLDEGIISQRIYQRHQQKQLSTRMDAGTQEGMERYIHLQNPQKTTLQKLTQTDPMVCTDCLLRKIKVRYNEETQTDIVHTVSTGAQTNPMPVQTVTEFGSITELTPNQVRAVSELIKYIKLTATSGNLREMRDSLKEHQVYNLNSDLRMAYHYFDAMVEPQKVGAPQKVKKDESQSFKQSLALNQPSTFIEDESVDEYEKIHRAFCQDTEEDNKVRYANPLLQPSMAPTMTNHNRFVANTSKNSYGKNGGNFGGSSQSQQGYAAVPGTFRRRI